VANCRTVRRLDELLESLPNDLNAAYERILLRIPSDERRCTKRMLEWMALSGRPMRIDELTHALAVNHPDLQGFAHEDLDVAPFESPLQSRDQSPSQHSRRPECSGVLFRDSRRSRT
jgi:hypothetical protein